jgi:hypothetical protein
VKLCGKKDHSIRGKQRCFNDDGRIKIDQEFYSSFPVIKFKVRGGDQLMAWYPQQYMTSQGCIDFDGDDTADQVAFGQSFLMHRDIMYDREKRTLSLVRAHCDHDAENPWGKPTKHKPRDVIEELTTSWGLLALLGLAVLILVISVMYFWQKGGAVSKRGLKATLLTEAHRQLELTLQQK